MVQSKLQATNKHLNKILVDMVELTIYPRSVVQLDRNIKQVENDLSGPEVSSKLTDLEDRFHCNNLCKDGIQENVNETWDLCYKEKIQKIIINKLGIKSPVEMGQCHRMGYKQQKKSRPVTLFVVLTNNFGQCKQIKKH